MTTVADSFEVAFLSKLEKMVRRQKTVAFILEHAKIKEEK